jgi:tetratricopeptide (TPR) repeat protein
MLRLRNGFGSLIVLTGVLVCLMGCGKPSAPELFQEGIQLLEQQNVVAARHRFQELVENYPDSEFATDAKIAIADCYNQEERYDDARQIYEEILANNSNNVYSWMANVRLGDTARVKENWEEAVKYFNAAIEDTTGTPQKLRAMSNLDQTYVSSQNPEKALETYDAMQEMSPNIAEKIQIGQIKTNYLYSLDRDDEAWTAISEVYEPTLPYNLMDQYYLSVMQAALSTGQMDKGLEFFSSKVDDSTDDEYKALALYFEGRLASSTEVTRATGVTKLKEVAEKFPQTVMGRWAPADAAVFVMTASNEFANPVGEASALFAMALSNYDDIINDMTTEWWYPQKAANAWRQVARIHEIRGLHLEEPAELVAASNTHAIVVEKFKDALPRVAESSYQNVQRLAAMVHVADTSPEVFWNQARRVVRGLAPVEEATSEASLEGSLEADVPSGATSAAQAPAANTEESPPAQP